MTALERRHRRWFYTFIVMGGLVIGAAICSAYRMASAQQPRNSMPMVVLPSAVPAEPPLPRTRSIVVPMRGELPLSPIPIAIPMPDLPELRLAQAPELLPLPKETAPPKPAPKPTERVPIENPIPLSVSSPVPPPSLPPLNLNFPKTPVASAPQPAPVVKPMASPLPPPPDFRLQSGQPGNNVKSTGPIPAAVPPMGIALQPPAEVVRIVPPVVTAREASTSLPAHTATTLQLGETPMPMSLRRQALSALLGTALITGTMFADTDPPAKPSEPAVTKKDLEETTKLLGEIQKDIASLRSKDLTDLKKDVSEIKAKDLAELKKELDSLKEFKKQTLLALEGSSDKAVGGDGLLKKMSSLDEKLTAINKQLDSLDKKLTDNTRTALASPLAKDSEKEKDKPKPGTVKIVNMYSTDVDVLVNGKGYRVPPQETKSLTLVAGTFTYQLLTAGGAEKTRTIKEGEEVTLLIN